MKRPVRAARGFSLLEVMVAGALFLISVTGVLSATSTATATFEHQRKLTQAMAVGEFAVEELLLRYTSHDELRLNGTTNGAGEITSATPTARCLSGDLTTSTNCRSGTVQPGIPFTGSVPVQIGDDGAYGVNVVVAERPGISLKHVLVIVAWHEVSGDRRVVLQTYRP